MQTGSTTWNDEFGGGFRHGGNVEAHKGTKTLSVCFNIECRVTFTFLVALCLRASASIYRDGNLFLGVNLNAYGVFPFLTLRK